MTSLSSQTPYVCMSVCFNKASAEKKHPHASNAHNLRFGLTQRYLGAADVWRGFFFFYSVLEFYSINLFAVLRRNEPREKKLLPFISNPETTELR